MSPLLYDAAAAVDAGVDKLAGFGVEMDVRYSISPDCFKSCLNSDAPTAGRAHYNQQAGQDKIRGTALNALAPPLNVGSCKERVACQL